MPEPEFIPATSHQRRSPDNRTARTLAIAVYILQALSFFTGGMSALIGVAINYIKLDDVRGSWLETHFRYQIRTFWIGLFWTVVASLFTVPLIAGLIIVPTALLAPIMLVVGAVTFLAIAGWLLWRVVKGALALNDDRPV